MNRIVGLVACLFVAGCTLEDGAAPTLTAPSEFGLSVTLSATPDQFPRDGVSQSTVTVTVRDAAGRPVAGQRLALATSMGTLSTSTVTTDSTGVASFTVTAPAASAIGNAAIVSVTPIGTDGANAAPRRITILLTGSSNLTRPTAAFTPVPATGVRINQSIRFDASDSRDEGAPCLDACSYSWDFGDGTRSFGRVVSKSYSTAGTYTVTLTVTDGSGLSASTAQTITVAAVDAPTVTIAVSPNPPLANQPATFTATATAGSGTSIARYEWTFGDGTSTTTTSPSVTKTYSNRGTYVATVTVRDTVGQTASASTSFTISSAGVTATFTTSPTNPVIGQTVHFNAAGSTSAAGGTITNYHWDFGDGSTAEGSGATTSHAYAAAGTYVARLTVTDSAGRTGTTTQNVTVAKPEEEE